MKEPSELIKNLYLARMTRIEAKRARGNWHCFYPQLGVCKNDPPCFDRYYPQEEEFIPYKVRKDCLLSMEREELNEAYRKAAHKAGAALTAVVKAGKKMLKDAQL